MPSRKLCRRDQIKPKRDSTRFLTGLTSAKLDGNIPTKPIEIEGTARSSSFVSVYSFFNSCDSCCGIFYLDDQPGILLISQANGDSFLRIVYIPEHSFAVLIKIACG